MTRAWTTVAMPISWKRTLVQYCRTTSSAPSWQGGGTDLRLCRPERANAAGMFEKRLATYRAIGYARGEAPLGFRERAESLTVEYDEEALRHFDSVV